MNIKAPSLGERIKELRLARGLSMRALAQTAGLKSVAFVADVERGFRNPSPDVLAALATALEQPLEALRRYDQRPPVQELRDLTERDPEWALALRRLVESAQAGEITPAELLRLLEGRPPSARPVKRSGRPAIETRPLFGE